MSPTFGKRPVPGSAATLAHLSSARRQPTSRTGGTPRTGAITRSTARTPTRTRTRTATARTQTRHEDAFLVAVIDNSVKDVGLCTYNLRGFDVQLRQFADSNTFASLITALCVFAPVEILLSLSSAGGLLDQAIQACPHLANVKRTFIGRTYFNETYGALMTEKLSNEACPNLTRLGESSCYLALACCGALIRYVEHVDNLVFAPSSLRIRFQPNDRTVFLDMPTLEGLEVVANARASNGLHGPSSKACLLRVMDKTKTRAGKRFLRRSLLEPCADIVTISMRQDAVDELANSEEMYFAVVGILAKFPDLERAMAALLARENARLRSMGNRKDMKEEDIHTDDESESSPSEDTTEAQVAFGNRLTNALPPSTALIQNVLTIKAALQTVAPILEAIQHSTSSLLKAVAESMRSPALLSLEKAIAAVIDEDALPAKDAERMRMQGAFAVKTGSNGRLDTARKILSENIEDMQALTDELRTKYGLHKLGLSMHTKRGYHFTLQRKFMALDDFPDEFIQIDEGKKAFKFSSEELGQLNLRYEDSLREIWKCTEAELGSLLNEIFAPEALTAVHRLCDSTAILDCLTSFVTYSSLSQTSMERPKLTEGGPVALQQAYHPTLLDLRPRTTVPNDLFLDETAALHIITGRNQAGKSTFVRMVGLICLMAHTGCAVPAKYATVRVLKRIASRFNTGDEISHSESHFSKEMRDVSTVFDSIDGSREANGHEKRTGSREQTTDSESSARSILVLIDELGRATSTLDGFAIASAVAEKLAASPNVLTLFTTHFLGLGALAMVNPTTKTCHLSTTTVTPPAKDDAGGEQSEVFTKFNYKVVNGILPDSSYGIETARLAGFPTDVTAEAAELSKQVPIRRIKHPQDYADAHLKLDDLEKSQLRKTSSIVAITQRLNLINASTKDSSERLRLRRNFKRKIKQSHQGAVSSGRLPSCTDGHLDARDTGARTMDKSTSNDDKSHSGE